MTIWANQKGTQTAVISTEHTLAQNSGANTFQFSVDTTAMVNGDITELRVYRIINSSAIQIANGIFANVQANPLKEYKFTASQGVTNGIKVTLKQTAGTGRNYDWELLADSSAVAANVTQWNGTNVASPATAGIPEVNVKNINNVATTSVTTINANVGVTQPINFTGTAGSALVKSDMVDVAGAAVSTSTAQIGVNVVQINAQTASAAGTVTFPGTVASTTNITAGTITTATNLTNAPTAGDFTATMKTSLGTAVAGSAVASVTGNVGGNVTGSVGSVVGNVGGNVTGSVGSLAATAKTDVSTAVLTTTMTESYPTTGAAFTLAQGVYNMVQEIGERAIVGTTVTIKKRDKSTTAKTYTLDSATAPTSSTETT